MSVKVKAVNLGLGVDLLGNKLSVQSNERTGSTVITGDIEDLLKMGVLCTSGKNGRVVFIPFANTKGMELQLTVDEILKLTGKEVLNLDKMKKK